LKLLFNSVRARVIVYTSPRAFYFRLELDVVAIALPYNQGQAIVPL
jgi:hypothetical protein